MNIKEASFVGKANPLTESVASFAYWQTSAPAKEIAKRLFMTIPKLKKAAGSALLPGVVCKHCKQEIIAKSRTHAVQYIRDHEDGLFYRREKVECEKCFLEQRNLKWSKQRYQPVRSETKREVSDFAAIPVVATDDKAEFYRSWDWRTLRTKVLQQYGARCMCCGAAPDHKTVGGEPVVIVVDHIKPLSKRWDLRLDRNNLQVLCQECNQGKGAWDETDFRPVPKTSDGEVLQ